LEPGILLAFLHFVSRHLRVGVPAFASLTFHNFPPRLQLIIGNLIAFEPEYIHSHFVIASFSGG
jgi:hypothetical protein